MTTTLSTRKYHAMLTAFKKQITYDLLTDTEKKQIDQEIKTLGIHEENLKKYLKQKYPKKINNIRKVDITDIISNKKLNYEVDKNGN